MSANSLSLKGLKFWDNYWFYPAPLFNLAVCRIIAVGFQLYYIFLKDYWTKATTVASIPGVSYDPHPILQVLNAPFPWDTPPIFLIMTIFFIVIVSGVLSLIGLRTNLSLLAFALSNLYIQTYIYAFGKTHHSQAIALVALGMLALSPAGKVLSVDDLSRRIKRNLKRKTFQPFNLLSYNSPFARWPLLLIQWMFGLIYLSAVLNKITIDGDGLFSAGWMNGHTLQYYLIRDGLWWDSSIGVWLGHQYIPAVIASWFAVLFEGTFFSTLLFPRLVWFYIPMGAALHTGIYIAQRAPFFHYIALYSVFIPWTIGVKRIANWLKWSQPSHKAEIFYDGLCPLCIRSMTVLCYFDWFGRLVYRDLEVDWPVLSQRHPEITLEDCRAQMHLLQPDGSVEKGFFAFREIIKYVPPLWPLLLVMYLPGASVIGPKLYGVVAAKR
ncbi:MAG: DCC1-like thiol-disulfide oxidoreductase family protein [Phormidesmis sp.]